MSGVLTNQQKSGEYYRIAYKCAETKQTTGCNGNCATCVLNVHLYVDDPREATLIKTSAAMDYGKYITHLHATRFDGIKELVAHLAALIIPILLFIIPISCVVKSCKPSDPVPQRTVSTEFHMRMYEVCKDIMEHIRDVDGDGLKDCVDRTLMFKDRVPEARIIWNRNPNNGFSHLFPVVNGIPIEIYNYNNHTFTQMTVEWAYPTKYDSRYNKDVTVYEYQIRANTMIWIWSRY